jgi:hypothetical protein
MKDLRNADPRLVMAARAIQTAARHYHCPPEEVLNNTIRNKPRVFHARYAVWYFLFRDAEWRLVDIAAEFRMSSSGIGNGVQKGEILYHDPNSIFRDCVEAIRGKLKIEKR